MLLVAQPFVLIECFANNYYIISIELIVSLTNQLGGHHHTFNERTSFLNLAAVFIDTKMRPCYEVPFWEVDGQEKDSTTISQWSLTAYNKVEIASSVLDK